jgi:metallo-beta-lactamase class B
MSARALLLFALTAAAACAPVESVQENPSAPPPTGAELAAACQGRDGWSDPAPPARIFGNVHYVGTCGITVLLIAGRDGHVLIDGATAEAVPSILANIRRLGFRPEDVRIILTSHEHVDHVGGIAALKRATGARLLARAEARRVLQTGETDPADPQAGAIPGFTGVPVDRIVLDGETVRVGRLALTAHATPGHTAGSTSWSWRSCEARQCRDFVYADSLTAVSREGYRFTNQPLLQARFRAAFDRVAALPCDVLITPHPSASNLFPRLAGEAPLADPNACRAYAETARGRLAERLAREAAQR